MTNPTTPAGKNLPDQVYIAAANETRQSPQSLVQELWQSDKASALTNRAARKIEALTALSGMQSTLIKNLLTQPSNIHYPWIPYFDDDLKKWRVGHLEFPGSDNYSIGPCKDEEEARMQAQKANRLGNIAAPSAENLLEALEHHT